MEPLTGEIEQRKKPIVLYIIIGILSIAVIVLSILLAINLGNKDTDNSKNQQGTDNEKPFNPINVKINKL